MGCPVLFPLNINQVKQNALKIAHFRVAACLSFKARPGAQSFKWKWVAYSYANKLISLAIVEYQDSLRNRNKQQLGNGPFKTQSWNIFRPNSWLLVHKIDRLVDKTSWSIDPINKPTGSIRGQEGTSFQPSHRNTKGKISRNICSKEVLPTIFKSFAACRDPLDFSKFVENNGVTEISSKRFATREKECLTFSERLFSPFLALEKVTSIFGKQTVRGKVKLSIFERTILFPVKYPGTTLISFRLERPNRSKLLLSW